MKKFISVLLAGIICIGLTGCISAVPQAGEESINKAKETYTELDSGKVEVVNSESGKTEQEFVFKIKDDDVMEYSYWSLVDGKHYSVYSDGEKKIENTDGEVTKSVKGDKDFVQYTRKDRHPNADSGLFLYEPSAIIESSTEETDEGVVYHHKYNTKKFDLEEGSELTAFDIAYYFDKSDTLIKMSEHSIVSTLDGSEEATYDIIISQRNSVDKVPDFTSETHN